MQVCLWSKCEQAGTLNGLCSEHHSIYTSHLGKPLTWKWLTSVGLAQHPKEVKVCEVRNCTAPYYAKGRCRNHYMQERYGVKKPICKREGCESPAIPFTKFSDGKPLPEEVVGLCSTHCNEWFQRQG